MAEKKKKPMKSVKKILKINPKGALGNVARRKKKRQDAMKAMFPGMSDEERRNL